MTTWRSAEAMVEDAMRSVLGASVIDPNVRVSGLIGKELPGEVVDLVRYGEFKLIARPNLLAEISGVLRRPKFARYVTPEQMGAIDSGTEVDRGLEAKRSLLGAVAATGEHKNSEHQASQRTLTDRETADAPPTTPTHHHQPQISFDTAENPETQGSMSAVLMQGPQ